MKLIAAVFSIGVFVSLIYAKPTLAITPSKSLDQFCLDRNNESFVKELTQDPSNLMAFRNQGGIGNGGVCWWHSRFQRHALYLTIFKPEENKPTLSEVEILIKKIRKGKEVVTIPGFNNFYEFTSRYAHLIQAELEAWQINDGVTKFGWTVGLSGKSLATSAKLQIMMDNLYQEVEVKNTIAYQKLQIKGITAHAWLVVNMKKLSNGYDLEVIDSNEQFMTRIYKYRKGDQFFNHWFYGNFVPYLERTNEMDNVKEVIKNACN